MLRRRGLFAAALAAVVASTIAVAGAADPRASCTRNGGTLRIVAPSPFEFEISRTASGAFKVTGGGLKDSDCGGATVNNVDTVEVQAQAPFPVLADAPDVHPHIIINLENGPFAPGTSPIELDDLLGRAEIEFKIVPSGPGAPESGLVSIRGSEAADTFAVAATCEVNLNGDGDADVALGGMALELGGGGGNDSIAVGACAEPIRLLGGEGNDALSGGPGDDLLRGGPGADVMRGGAGVDVADYSDRTQGVMVVLDGRANDGAPGEQDQVDTDIEEVIGGRGDDVLIGSDADNELHGGPVLFAPEGSCAGPGTMTGNDRILGGGGDDIIHGHDGADDLRGEGGNDVIHGGAGADVILGGDGADRMQGGACRDRIVGGRGDDRADGGGDDDTLQGESGNDVLRGGDGDDLLVGNLGEDTLLGQTGDDVLRARDATPDVVSGGGGRDAASADSMDTVTGVERRIH